MFFCHPYAPIQLWYKGKLVPPKYNKILNLTSWPMDYREQVASEEDSMADRTSLTVAGENMERKGGEGEGSYLWSSDTYERLKSILCKLIYSIE